jgi:hypothetical protein
MAIIVMAMALVKREWLATKAKILSVEVINDLTLSPSL